MKKVKKKPVKTMEELTKDFEKFIEGKELNENNKVDFEKLLTKTTKKKENQ